MEALVSQARVVVEEAVQRSHAYLQWQADRQAENLREINRALLTTFDARQLTDVLVERLPGLGIPSVYLVAYERPSEAEVPEQARLMLAYTDQERAVIAGEGLRFSTDQVIPQNFLPQARLDAEKADRIKSRLLANVSHELRTPLNIIMGYTQAALQSSHKYGNELSASLLSDIHQIQSNAEHQLRVIDDLLDLSRAEIDELDLSLELIDPHPLLLEAFHNLADQSTSPHIQWEMDIPERLPQIRADAVRLRQIFLKSIEQCQEIYREGPDHPGHRGHAAAGSFLGEGYRLWH